MKLPFLNCTALITLVFLSSCASLKSVSLTQVPVDRSRPIQAQSSSWGIFGIYFSNDFVDETIEGLKDKCPQGKVSGVFTKFEVKYYVLWATRTVTAKAFCESPRKI